MAESQEEWKGYLIIRQGPLWRIRKNTRWCDNAFTSPTKAKQYIDFLVLTNEEKEFNRSLREIKQIPDLKKRSKEYKKLCQTAQSS